MLRPVALLLTMLTGFSGLVYEVTWEKALATLLGSHAEATAAVLGLFLGGLALGYALFGRFTQRRLRSGRPPKLILAYGLIEAGIGLSALAFPISFAAVQALSFALPHPSPAIGFAADVGLSALLIGPPVVLMGGTIPILTQALARGVQDATRVHAWVYAVNTAGAFGGALAAGFWIIPALGIEGSIRAMGVLNLVAGAAFVLLGRGSGEAAVSAPGPDTGRGARDVGFSFCAAAALLVGFAMMTLQTVLIRVGALSFGASQFTFSMVVAAFVLCIAVGSLAVSAPRKLPSWLLPANLLALALCLVLLYQLVPGAPYWAHRLRVLFPREASAFHLYHLTAMGGVLAVIGLPAALSGATLPLLFDQLRNRMGDLGDVAGRLYSANTLGSLLGALLGGYALFFWLDLHHVFRIAVFAVCIAGVLVARICLAGRARSLAPALAVSIAALVALLPAWSPDRLHAGFFRVREATPETLKGPDAMLTAQSEGWRLVFHDDDPTASVSVHERVSGRLDRTIRTNGKSDGGAVGDRLTMSLAGLLPALLAQRAEQAFVIGYGTGVTVGALASLDSMRRIVVSEISPAVVEAGSFFEELNDEALLYPGTEVVRSDAYRALMRSAERYDVISSEPSNPWVLGVEMLFSVEFLRAARDHLRPGGVHCQWFHTYETDAETIELVLRNYAEVFDDVAVWYAQGSDLLILGLAESDPDVALDRIVTRFEQPDYATVLRSVRISSVAALLGHELLPVGTLQALGLEGDLHTLLHPRLGYRAARAFFAGRNGPTPTAAPEGAARVATQNSLLRRWVDRRGYELSATERLKLVKQVCEHRSKECVTLLAHWRHTSPHSRVRRDLEEQIRGRPDLAQRIDFDIVEEVSQLYASSPEARSDPYLPAGRLGRETNLFSSYYHPAVPFSRSRLAERWGRCRDGAPGRLSCERGRALTEAALGTLRRDD